MSQWKADFETERRDRERAHNKVADLEKIVTTYQKDNEGLHKQLVEHQQTLSAIEVLNQKLTKEVQLAREKCQGLEQDIHAKSSQVKQYAKEMERLKQQV